MVRRPEDDDEQQVPEQAREATTVVEQVERARGQVFEAYVASRERARLVADELSPGDA
jgi:hypothetical protein